MTMIAHGVLALNKYLKNKEVKELESRSTAELSEKERADLADKLKKAYDSWDEAGRKMDKLKRAERKIDIFADVFRLQNRGGALALTRTVTVLVVATPLVAGALAYTGLKEAATGLKKAATALKEANTKIEEQKRAMALKAKEEAKRIAQENDEKAEESAEMPEINLLKKLVSDSDIVQIRRVDIPTDKNAIVAGLIDECGQIAEFASKHGRMLFFFDNNPEAKIVNAFFVNPETGNFEGIATVKSVRGRKQIVDLINSQHYVKKQKQKEHEEAQIRNAEIMSKMKEKQNV